jgi:glycosyltransferase involved in cell wall biosynthesis
VSSSSRRVLVLSENESVPHDRRVWDISLALRRAGYEVVVIAPQGDVRDTALFERIEGVELHRYRGAPADGGPLGYLLEYGTALWHTCRLVRRVSRGRSFDVVHACNPPDLLLLAALPLRRRGARFVFDHHDLVPELYLSRFDRGEDLLYRIVRATERLAFRLADVVIATNDSYRAIAITRGRKSGDDVFVVKNAPDVARFCRGDSDPSLSRGARHLLAYVGVMGPQDGVDHALRALALLKQRRRDWHALFVGDGDARPEMEELASRLELDGLVEFAGWRGDADIIRMLSSADVCLAPDPKSPLNDLSTMVKIGEYMAMSCPIVSYDLAEARASAGEAASYARANDEADFAARIDELLDDPARREAMGAAGRARAESTLSWEYSVRELLAAYERALGPALGAPAPLTGAQGQAVAPL